MDTGNEASKTTETPVTELAQATIDGLQGNATASSGTVSPAISDRPAWHLETPRNFLRDDRGRILLRRGKPMRSNGKPRKLQPGEVPAGQVERIDAEPASGTPAIGQVVIEAEATPNVAQATQEVAQETPATGPEAGEVLTDLLFNTAQAVKGDAAKPKPEEREAVKKYAESALSGWRLWPPLALALFVAAYIFRVVSQSRNQANEPKSSVHSRPDQMRQESVGKAPRWIYPTSS